eukprot:GILJ01002022.1.p1 GENE.GILJ01002022.1~~GILJ01002022.1.p1  ORF type:complete len:445 (+),score=75.70 GILJ01002022.1:76-1335(+)
MVRIQPFKAFRPRPDLAKDIASPPYDVLDTEEARTMAGDNQFSFLHVNKPEIDLAKEVDIYDETVYQKGCENLKKFVGNGWLVRDNEPSLYVYAQKMGEHRQYGIMAGASVQEYENNLIKKHELTRKKKEEDRTKLTHMQNANIGPVFLTYRSSSRIDEIVAGVVSSKAPEHDFTADDGVQHTVWVVPSSETAALVECFQEIPCSYIADGHHRAASAYNVGKMKRAEAEKAGAAVTGEEEFNFFMACFFPHDQLRIMDYNRIVKDLNGFTAEQFLDKVREKFDVSAVGGEQDPKPTQRRHFSMYLGSTWYRLVAKEGSFDNQDPVKSLDVEILTNNILAPLLNIGDLRTDDRIDFVGGIRGLRELESRCDVDRWAVAFALYPVSLEELMSIADAGEIMPPKSTWFEPKLRSGVLVRIMD